MSIKNYLKYALGALLLIPASPNAANVSVTTNFAGGKVSACPVTDNIIRVTYQLDGQTAKAFDTTHPSATVWRTGDDFQTLTTKGGIIVTLKNSTGELSINGGANKIVSSVGLPTIADGYQRLQLYTSSTGSYYGAGERGHKVNLRGDSLVMYNRQNYGYTKGDPRISQMNITMPLFVSSDGFAVVFDDFAAAEMILGNDASIEYITENPQSISWYYVLGEASIADVTEQLSSLTGRQPLPPLWSLGYITSKYGYHTEKETVGAIDSLKTRGYPVDGIVLDLYWYGKEQDMGRLAWEPKQWPDPKKMLAKLKKDNVNLIAISQPYVLRNGNGLDNYNYLAANGMLVADSTGKAPQEVKIWVGEGGMLDVSNPNTREWLANKYKELTDMGVTGWWGDLGEPEVHPETGMHANGLNARLYHNKYGNDWSQIIYDMFQKEYPDTRLVTMMRGGTTGLQQYSVFPWSTDVSRSWGGLQPQITIMLNSGLSGLGYMGHDVGGFAIDPENPIDPELYVRWLQLGLFSPMLRTHAQFDAEPYHYPEYANIILPIIKERYRWLPYNYTLAYENASKGYPLVRPLNFYEPGSNAYDDIDDEFLWGNEVLVAPVVQQGATERKIVFPQGQWVDMAKPTDVYQGGSEITYKAPLDVLPLFVKAGSFVPMADYKLQSTAAYNPARVTVNYYPVAGVDSEYTMYDDNRISSSSLKNGQFRLISFKGVNKDGAISISVASEGSYAGAPDKIEMNFAVHGLNAQPTEVNVDGKKVKTTFANGTLSFPVKFIPGKQLSITIK